MTRVTNFKRTHVQAGFAGPQDPAPPLKKSKTDNSNKASSEKRRLNRIQERKANTTCFACREKGHDARECPQSKGKPIVGICYRCGSSRHTLARCKKKVDPQNPLPFASCFVCDTKGHLASTCPDNVAKGIYPNGGCCKLCRETSHLAKDCPLRQQDSSKDAVVFGSGRDAGADEDDFHILKRHKNEVDRDEKNEERRRRAVDVKAGSVSGVVKAFGLLGRQILRSEAAAFYSLCGPNLEQQDMYQATTLDVQATQITDRGHYESHVVTSFLTMTSWQNSPPESTYHHYFSLTRPEAPADACTGTSLSDQDNGEAGDETTHVHYLDVEDLTHNISDAVQLNLSAVHDILSSTGPNLSPLGQSQWQLQEWPFNIQQLAYTEHDLYLWLEWVIFWPATHAVTAVRDRLYDQAGIPVPSALRGSSDTRCIYGAKPRGTTDILFSMQHNGKDMHICPHEVKRAHVLTASGDVLGCLVRLARKEGGWQFRGVQLGGVEGKARQLLCQIIDELIWYELTHLVLATQEKYVLLLLDETQQLCVSSIYTINSSATQTCDMEHLVLFYVHALLNKRPPYPPSPSSSSSASVYRVAVPNFPPRLFQLPEALLCHGALVHRVKLAPISVDAIPRPFTLRLTTSHGDYRHDGEIAIFFGSLVFLMFEAKIVVKAAYQPFALSRLQHEFAVYRCLRGLQGVVVPSLFGMYRNLSDGSSILVVSYAGVALENFDQLTSKERQTLFRRVTQLHQAGVVHNDLEPRNVVLCARYGPRIIDFDNSSMNHTCPGGSCQELCLLARSLGLDLETELSKIRGKPQSLWQMAFLFTLIAMFYWMIAFAE
ncbi:hypothetical protein MIND_01026800 [Mycena indigotica]|uniref:CCHC-type domain-containing protein n=1 Tax=Mycena indigotica TaxID=2126181 RepID=A0A8H6S8Q0_9AGAR|nr:uncharacterized protein MIND_01026800 [Mycena indigotica]KAF7294889.1 hypothetical protein MIND_01026800 [Mycena indigotica]